MFRSLVDIAQATLTTKGDLLVKTSAGFARQAVSTDGFFLSCDSTQTNGIKWASPGTRSVSSSQTGTYAIQTTDDVVLYNCAGGSFTTTLPTAVGVTGKVYTLIRTNATASVAVTIATTSSQTIGGIASGAITLDYQAEQVSVVSDGSNWQITGWSYPQKQTTFSVTGSNWTTHSAVGIIYKSIDGTWRVRFNIQGVISVATNNITLTIANVTFKNLADTNRQAVYVANNSNGGAPDNCFVNGNASTLVASFASNTTNPIIGGDVELNAKPAIAL